MARSMDVLFRFLGDPSGAVGAANKVGGAIGGLTGVVKKMSATGDAMRMGLTGMFAGKGKAILSGLETFRMQVMNLNDVFRFTAQGITNLGRSLMFFVTLPVAAFLGKMSKTAIDYEDALIRVRKTTNLTGEETAWLGDKIRELSRNTATGHVELAGIAEVLGQAGVTAKEAIFNLTVEFDRFAIATGIAGDEVTANIAKIANAFGWNLNNASKDVNGLLNAMNQLENDTAATAQEIMDATTNFAPYAKMVHLVSAEFPNMAANAAAFAATLVSVGLSGEEAGTALRNMMVQIPRHAEAVSAAMKPIKAGYEDADAVIKKMNEDSVGLFLDIIEAATQSGDKVKSMLTLMGMATMRGGRGLAALAGNIDLLRQNLVTANLQFVTQTSILAEYERAMTSTKSQMAMLRNNVNDAGITIGKVLLPVINRLVGVLVPAIRMAADAFEKLDKATQMQIVTFVVLGLAAGPLLMFFGQILHAVTLLNLAFGQLFRVILWIIPNFFKLGSVLAGVGKFLLSWPGLIVGAIVLLLKVLSQMGVDVAGFFTNLANSAIAWGENLAANIANGFIAGAVRFIGRAVAYVANLISSFFESHSPPKEGPLSTIDKWGSALMKTFLNGFKNADFSILKDVSAIIERVLTSGVSDKAMPNALKKLASARSSLAGLIAKFNKTGVIDENALAKATRGLGEIGENVRELIRLSLRYNQLQERLAQLEAKRKNTLKTYKAEIGAIGASNMSIEDKVAAIRASQRARDDSLRGIDQEKEATQEQSDAVKEQIEWQKNYIEAMTDTMDIMERIADALAKLAKGGGAGGGGDLGFGDLEELKKKFEAAQEEVQGVIDRFNDGKLALQGFLDAWNGTGMKSFGPGEKEKAGPYYEMYELGEKAAGLRDKILGIRDAALAAWQGIQTFFANLGNSISEGTKNFDLSKLFGDIDWANLPIIKEFMAGWDLAFDPATVQRIRDAADSLSESWGKLMDALGTPEAKAIWHELGVGLSYVGKIIGVVVYLIATGLAFWIGVFAGFVASMIGYGATFQAWVMGWVTYIITTIITVVGEWTARFEEMRLNTIEKLTAIWTAITTKIAEIATFLTGKVEEFKTLGTNIIEGLHEGFKSAWDKVAKWFDEIKAKLQGIADLWDTIRGNKKNIDNPPIPATNDASGGYVQAGGATWVNEVGQEMFVPSQNGLIIPHGALWNLLGAGGGSSNVINNINVEVNNPTVRDGADIKKLAAEVGRQLADQLNRKVNYGGNFG